MLWVQQISDEVCRTAFLSTFNFNIWYVHRFQQLQQHISLASIYFLRTSTLMLSHAFCNSRQRLSFEYTIDLSSLFSNSLEGVEVRTLRGPVHHFQCSSRFLPSQVVLAIVCFMGIYLLSVLCGSAFLSHKEKILKMEINHALVKSYLRLFLCGENELP